MNRRYFLKYAALAGIASPGLIGFQTFATNLPALPAGWRADALLQSMTLEEKVRQICAVYPGEGDEILVEFGHVSQEKMSAAFGSDGAGAVSVPLGKLSARNGAEAAQMIQDIAMKQTRLRIPAFLQSEALHGLWDPESACFPQAIAMASTWDTVMMAKVSDRIGREARARGIRMLFSPVLDLARDPRHGRVEETYGEDPLLASRFGVAFVRGVQAHKVICTPKHFAANFVGPGGRDSGDIEISERELRELHLAPYEAVVREAGALGIMSAYNTINGVPSSANPWLLDTVLRKEWGFKGVIVSDWSAVRHGYDTLQAAPNQMAAARNCLVAGLDMDLPRPKLYAKMAEEVRSGRIDIKYLDAAVRRILFAKEAIGLLDPREKISDPDEADRLSKDEERRSLPLAVARKAIVLLKNEKQILPLAASVKRIAVIGPNANVLRLGGYSAKGVIGPTPLDAIRARFGKSAEILHAEGCALVDGEDADGDKKISDAVKTAQQADISILVVGGNFGVTGGESQDRSTIELQGRQEELIKAVAAAGKPVVVVLINGHATGVRNWLDHVGGLVCAWYGGSEGNTALAEVLAGDINPSGHLPVTFPKNTGQAPMTYDMRRNGREGGYAGLNKKHLQGDRYDPEFPFGFGLSYTSFAFSDLELSTNRPRPGSTTTVRVKVTNTGDRYGETVAQLYVSAFWQPVAPRARKLCDFARVALKPGESKFVTLTLTAKDLSYLDIELRPTFGPGEYIVTVGEHCLATLTTKLNTASTDT